MSNAAGGATGQAPTTPPEPGATGQAPTTPLTNNTTTPSSGQTGQAPTATTQYTAPDEQTWRRFQQELDEARRDAAKSRDELKKRDDAALSAEEKRERDFAELQTKNLEYEARLQRLSLSEASHRLAPTLGISDAGAALALVYSEHEHEIESNADGSPKNLDKLLKAVLADHPILATSSSSGGANTPGAGASSGRPAANSGGATAPGAGATPGGLSRAIIQRMSQGEINARIHEINAWLANNPGAP